MGTSSHPAGPWLLLCGTRKGLFLFTSDNRRDWRRSGPFLRGKEINHAIFDHRTSRVYATENDAWFGSGIARSEDLGLNWTTAAQNPTFAAETGLKLDRIWHLEPGPDSSPEVLYAGTAPAALFRSADGGSSWSEVAGLTSHPTRPLWHPGAGGLCLHSIVLDPLRPERMFAGISAVGVFRTDDSGKTWRPVNRGTRAEFMPDKYPEFGQCVHKLLMAPGENGTLYQQNHCGVYQSADAGESWREITAGLPSDFGFPLAVHPRDPQTVFVLPLQGAEFRCPPGGKLQVYRSRDGGNHWDALGKGLPSEHAFLSVYREGMASDQGDPAGVYFGTNTGKLFTSTDEGDSWTLLADNLPPIFSVSISRLRHPEVVETA
jgi:photosystem II stability/assembly factor-like uncharacterized protein